MNIVDDGKITLSLEASDTWFFRESKPHDAIGVTQLGSVFPPPAPTVLGAVTTLIGDLLDVDWRARADGQPQQSGDLFEQLIGTVASPGQLKLDWILPALNGDPLYPVPFDLLLSVTTKNTVRLKVGAPVSCDLGVVALPSLPKNAPADAKPIEGHWLTQKGFQQYLSGIAPTRDHVVSNTQLFSEEARLGIGRNNAKGTVIEGLLYQTQHLRLAPEFSLQCGFSGLPVNIVNTLKSSSHTVRIGGEGRPAFVNHLPQSKIDLPTPKINSEHFVLTLISHLQATDSKTPWLPDGFEPFVNDEGLTQWRGTLLGIGITIESAAVGKQVREGGWDMQRHEPKPVMSYIPAGTSYFCTLTEKAQIAELPKLHLTHLSPKRHLGHGLVVIGNR